MTYIHNKRKLWNYMKREYINIFNKGSDRILSQEIFFKDFKRFLQDLFVFEESMDEIILQAQEQTEMITLIIKAICAAVKIIENDQNQIEKAYLEMVSILEQAPDQFESILLSSIAKLKTDLPEIAEAFQNVVPILKRIIDKQTETQLFDQKEIETLLRMTSIVYPKPIKPNQKLITYPTEIEWLKIISNLKKDNPNTFASDTEIKNTQSLIEATLWDKAVDDVINKLFKEKKEKEEKISISKAKKPLKKDLKKVTKEFLKLFLHQGFIYFNINLLSTFNSPYIFLNPHRTIKLVKKDEDLLIQVSFFTDQIFNYVSGTLLESISPPYVKGEAEFKVNIVPYNQGGWESNLTNPGGWVAKVSLVNSSLDCSPHFKNILDSKNFLEKIQEFLETILQKLKDYLSFKPKFESLFFVSKDGNSVFSKPISADNPDSGKIINLIMQGATHS